MIWIISRKGFVGRIKREIISLHPEIDTTIINFQESITNIHAYKPRGNAVPGMKVSGIGHRGNIMPSVDAEWRNSEFIIKSANLAKAIKDESGTLKKRITFNIYAENIKMQGIGGFELSFEGQKGMSGGPVVDSINGEVVGMLSLGLPSESFVKKKTFAISIEEVLKKCRCLAHNG